MNDTIQQQLSTKRDEAIQAIKSTTSLESLLALYTSHFRASAQLEPISIDVNKQTSKFTYLLDDVSLGDHQGGIETFIPVSRNKSLLSSLEKSIPNYATLESEGVKITPLYYTNINTDYARAVEEKINRIKEIKVFFSNIEGEIVDFNRATIEKLDIEFSKRKYFLEKRLDEDNMINEHISNLLRLGISE